MQLEFKCCFHIWAHNIAEDITLLDIVLTEFKQYCSNQLNCSKNTMIDYYNILYFKIKFDITCSRDKTKTKQN